jgi:hypothetical protein
MMEESMDVHTDTSISARPPAAPGRAAVTLDGFTTGVERADGLRLRDVSPCGCVHLRTRNSHYRLWMLNPLEGRVRIQGGSFFCEPSEAVIAGATAGGSMLKVGWILRGFHLEILHEGQRIVTTAVRWLQLEEAESVHGPF